VSATHASVRESLGKIRNRESRNHRTQRLNRFHCLRLRTRRRRFTFVCQLMPRRHGANNTSFAVCRSWMMEAAASILSAFQIFPRFENWQHSTKPRVAQFTKCITTGQYAKQIYKYPYRIILLFFEWNAFCSKIFLIWCENESFGCSLNFGRWDLATKTCIVKIITGYVKSNVFKISEFQKLTKFSWQLRMRRNNINTMLQMHIYISIAWWHWLDVLRFSTAN